MCLCLSPLFFKNFFLFLNSSIMCDPSPLPPPLLDLLEATYGSNDKDNQLLRDEIFKKSPTGSSNAQSSLREEWGKAWVAHGYTDGFMNVCAMVSEM